MSQEENAIYEAREEQKPDKFKIGDKVKHKDHGIGIVHQINESNMEFHYDFHFEDGTKVWMDKKFAEKVCKLA